MPPAKANSPSALARGWLWEHFKYLQLNRVERQREGGTFSAALNKLRIGQIDAEVLALFEPRQIDEWTPEESAQIPADALHLFRDNESVDNYNARALDKLEENGALVGVSTAVDDFSENLHHYYNQGLNATVDEKKETVLVMLSRRHHSATRGMQHQLRLVIHARYMMTSNVDTADGLVNGVMGRLERFDHDPQNPKRIYLLWIAFDDQRIGRKMREAYAQLVEEIRGRREQIDDTWTPVKLQKQEVLKTTIQTVRGFVEREQFPLVPAHAVTIYKAQGGTFSSVVFHLPLLNHQQAPCRLEECYVACSRVSTIDQLFIADGTFPKHLPINRAISAEYTRLGEKVNSLRLRIPQWQEMELTNRFRVVSHDVQGLDRSWGSMMADEGFYKAQILLLTGTGLTTDEEVIHYDWQRSGFEVVPGSQIAAHTESEVGGSCVVVKSELTPMCQVIATYFDNHLTTNERLEITVLRVKEGRQAPLFVLSVFKTLKYPVHQLLTQLRQMVTQEMRSARLLITGNMGIDMKQLEAEEDAPAELLYTLLTEKLKLTNLLDFSWSRDKTTTTTTSRESVSLAENNLPATTFTGEHTDLAFGTLSTEEEERIETTPSNYFPILANTYVSATSTHAPIFILF